MCLCVPFIQRSLHFLGMSFLFLFLFLWKINFFFIESYQFLVTHFKQLFHRLQDGRFARCWAAWAENTNIRKWPSRNLWNSFCIKWVTNKMITLYNSVLKTFKMDNFPRLNFFSGQKTAFWGGMYIQNWF